MRRVGDSWIWDFWRKGSWEMVEGIVECWPVFFKKKKKKKKGLRVEGF